MLPNGVSPVQSARRGRRRRRAQPPGRASAPPRRLAQSVLSTPQQRERNRGDHDVVPCRRRTPASVRLSCPPSLAATPSRSPEAYASRAEPTSTRSGVPTPARSVEAEEASVQLARRDGRVARIGSRAVVGPHPLNAAPCGRLPPARLAAAFRAPSAWPALRPDSSIAQRLSAASAMSPDGRVGVVDVLLTRLTAIRRAPGGVQDDLSSCRPA